MKWDHCGIRATDLERSLRFYTDVLGLELLEVVTVLDQPFYFVGNDTVRIEIEQANPAQLVAATGTQAGLYHLAFEVRSGRGIFWFFDGWYYAEEVVRSAVYAAFAAWLAVELRATGREGARRELSLIHI